MNIKIRIVFKWILLFSHIILLISFVNVIYSRWIAEELMARALPLSIVLGLSAIACSNLIKIDN